MSNGFYRAFEERYRGSRELVKSRLKVYLPFIIPLKKFTTSPRSLDLGCGRGEWLELLTENGFNAYGVDLDDEMLKACRQLGLKSKKIDAVKYLKEEADESHDLISGLHIVEHLPFEKLQTLVSEALRVLKPAGLMILETPNPENIVVGSKSFYIDPTHERPIPPELLSFVVEHAGFFRVKVVRLQESKDLASNVRLSLMNVLAGASPDYSVVAQKHAEPDVVEHFDSAFSKNYGIDLNFLADNYDHQIEDRLTQTEDQQAHSQWLQNEWDTAKEKIETLSHRTGALEVELAQEQSAKEQLHSELTQTHEQLGKAQAQAEVMFQQSNERAAQAEAKAQQATERAAQAEAATQQATERAAQAEAMSQQSRTNELPRPRRQPSRPQNALPKLRRQPRRRRNALPRPR
jgi:O-antigen chain-terminating methyltransferase